MIVEINVQNIALIAELSFQPIAGMTVLTGETGTGKSILLGALSLLLGERANVDLIRTNCETAAVEGLFDIAGLESLPAWLDENGLPPCEDNMLLVKRVLYRNGRGKCYVNGSLTTLANLETLGNSLVDLHGQHAHQSLMHKEHQRSLLDRWASLENVVHEVEQAYQQLKKSREARDQLSLDEAERSRRVDMLGFQIKEIEHAALQPGEAAQLSEERGKLIHAERLLGTVNACLERLHRQEEGAVHDGLSSTAEALASITDFDPAMGALADDLRSAGALVDDVVSRLNDFSDSFEADPKRLEWIEERLDLIQRLQRKYGGSEESVLAFMDQAVRELENLNLQDTQLEHLAAEEKKHAVRLADLTQRLSQARTRAGELLSQQMEVELKSLGFQQAVFKVEVTPRKDENGWISWEHQKMKCGPEGVDEVEFLIAPNPGETLKPVAKTASGGELSRIMLAIKVIAAAAATVPTMIFDEVDAGIGGATAEAVGKRLQLLAQKRQVMVITHLPQIARFGQKHFLVSKEVSQGRTTTTVAALEEKERVHEMARLLAGDKITETALKHARELME